jgi:dTDP-4-dehydrorhamnose reductase
MTKIVVLGASGMLGSMLVEYFAASREFALRATVRDANARGFLHSLRPRVELVRLDAETCTVEDVLAATHGAAWVINAIGLIKQRIVDSDPTLVERAIRTNAVFPHTLARAAQIADFRVVQVATDCVYSGASGGYSESAAHDCLDVYGKSKSLGEISAGCMLNLRCSIVGLERGSNLSLLDWFLSQPQNATVNGFTNHRWNGITTLHFARICAGIIKTGLRLPSLMHVVPADEISKDGLLRLFAEVFGRRDVEIVPVEAKTAVDRTLTTEHAEANSLIWRAAGYAQPPSIAQMVEELGAYRTQNARAGAASDLQGV